MWTQAIASPRILHAFGGPGSTKSLELCIFGRLEPCWSCMMCSGFGVHHMNIRYPKNIQRNHECSCITNIGFSFLNLCYGWVKLVLRQVHTVTRVRPGQALHSSSGPVVASRASASSVDASSTRIAAASTVTRSTILNKEHTHPNGPEAIVPPKSDSSTSSPESVVRNLLHFTFLHIA